MEPNTMRIKNPNDNRPTTGTMPRRKQRSQLTINPSRSGAPTPKPTPPKMPKGKKPRTLNTAADRAGAPTPLVKPTRMATGGLVKSTGKLNTGIKGCK